MAASDAPTNAWVVYFDGGSRGNPGVSGAGAALFVDGTEVAAAAHSLQHGTTNNEAEYLGAALAVHLVARALRLAAAGAKDPDGAALAVPSSVTILGDSKLVVQQVRGKWQVRAKHLVACVAQVRAAARAVGRQWLAAQSVVRDASPRTAFDVLQDSSRALRDGPVVQWAHVPRARNKRADALSNHGMDAVDQPWDCGFHAVPSPFAAASALGRIAHGALGVVKACVLKVLE